MAARVPGGSYVVDCCVPVCIELAVGIPVHCCFLANTRNRLRQHYRIEEVSLRPPGVVTV